MDRSYHGWARALNIDPSELTIGPSTSANTYMMAQAIGAPWTPGDEIIVTNQDHEANSGVWRRKATEKGATIRQLVLLHENALASPLLEFLRQRKLVRPIGKTRTVDIDVQHYVFETRFTL